MRLIDILNKDMIWADLMSKSKKDIISELSEKVSSKLQIISKENLEKVLVEREELGSTGTQDGVAIPHGRLNNIDNVIVAFARSVDGVDFDAHDSKPTHLFFVLLAPESQAGQHLKALARLSKLLKDSVFRDKLLKANSSEEIYKFISEEDSII